MSSSSSWLYVVLGVSSGVSVGVDVLEKARKAGAPALLVIRMDVGSGLRAGSCETKGEKGPHGDHAPEAERPVGLLGRLPSGESIVGGEKGERRVRVRAR